eukprot:TRINITY_DN10612_c0_g1_i1.p1 TRINITY_DN10612_c0_g1~~TRINITY_DN10612_c0_g1_i1.p1  ORF type:complete len:633 (-),score=192.44 TRINITY_DN10612_c0_g1_i1:23-1921(-)
MEWQRYLQQQQSRPASYRGGGYARGGYSAAPRPYQSKPVYPARPAVRPGGRGVPQARPQVRRQLPATVPRRPPAAAPTAAYPRPYGAPAQPPRSFASMVSSGLNGSFSFVEKERRLTDTCHRYPRLCLSQNFSKFVVHWPESKALDIPLDVPISFHTDPDLTLPVPEGTDVVGPKTVARVMLLSIAKQEEPEADKPKPKPHLSKNIKFLVAKKANGGLMSIGGAWSKEKDGGDPSSDATLIKTATRHCKEICGIDLSVCKQWHKFVEIHYKRESGDAERTVIFVPDIWNHLQTGTVNVYKQVQRQETDVEEEVEVEVEDDDAEKEGEKKTKKIKKKVTTKKIVDNVVVRSMDLSLNGILEYDLQDKHEETAELSLFAEAFDEMLSFKNAQAILEILKKKKVESDEKAAELKRKREADAAERAAKLAADREERDAKRQKLEEDRKAELEARKKKEEEEKFMTEEQIKERRQQEAEVKKQKDEADKKLKEEANKKRLEEEQQKKAALEEEKKKKAEEEAKKTTKTVTVTTTNVDMEMVEPFSYFDKPFGNNGQQSGQLKREKLESLLYSIGDLCPREVEGYLRAVGLPKEKPQQSLYYKTLATTTVISTKEVPIEEKKEEKSEPMEEDAEAEKK